MKVYELMNKLAKMPSGAFVEVTKSLTIDELTDYENLGTRADGSTVFSITEEVRDVDYDDMRATIYTLDL